VGEVVTKLDVLRAITFGSRIAEDEPDLNEYFVETELWRRIYAGEIDVVMGAKGSGKSAIYSLLQKRKDEFARRKIVVLAAENPRGTPAFRGLVVDPPASEREFMGLWKLYFLVLVTDVLGQLAGTHPKAKAVLAQVEDAGLKRRDRTLQAVIRGALDYARRVIAAEKTLEGGIRADPNTGVPIVTGKITLGEPTEVQRELGAVSADDLLKDVNEALRDVGQTIWLLIDRLDVAFADNDTLEQNVLRALFHVYLDLAEFGNLRLKIFLRSDIWERITLSGFREGSHITRQATITWNPDSLLNLAIRRLLRNEAIRTLYGVDEREVLSNALKQRGLFYRAYPIQVDSGPKQPETFDWLLSRTRDGLGINAPRELIHLLEATREAQLAELEVGKPEPPDETLFTAVAIKGGLPTVSEARLNQTLYAEYPQLRERLEVLKEEKTQQTSETLAKIWRVTTAKASKMADDLVDVGFFERRGPRDDPVYWVPFLYRDALKMSQGSAE
jgi:hypothetical protein